MIGPAAGAIAAAGFSAAGLTIVGISASVAGLFLIWFNPPIRNPFTTDGQNVPATETALATSRMLPCPKPSPAIGQLFEKLTLAEGPVSPGLAAAALV